MQLQEFSDRTVNQECRLKSVHFRLKDKPDTSLGPRIELGPGDEVESLIDEIALEMASDSQNTKTIQFREYGKRCVVRLGVSGDLRLGEVMRLIIDTPEFQRLRYIRQLGFAYYSWASANHTRFEHSLGVYQKAFRMIQAINFNQRSQLAGSNIQINPAETIVILLAALLHDITHIPMGHSLEDELHVLRRHDHDARTDGNDTQTEFSRHDYYFGDPNKKRQDRPLASILARITLLDQHDNKYSLPMLLRQIISFKDRLIRAEEDDVPLRIHRLEVGTNDSPPRVSLVALPEDALPVFRPFMADIISNTICADLLDYLVRDSRTIGMPLSFDERLFSQMVLANGVSHNEGLRLALLIDGEGKALRRDLLTEVFRVLEGRYLLNERVFYHRAKASASCMLAYCIHQLSKYVAWSQEIHKSLLLTDFLRDEDSISSNTRLLEKALVQGMYGDDEFRVQLTILAERLSKETEKQRARIDAHKELGTISEMLNALRERRLHKEVYHITNSDAVAAHGGTIDYATTLTNSWKRRSIEAFLESKLKERFQSILPGTVLVYCPSPDMNSKQVMARVVRGPGRPAEAIASLENQDPVIRTWIDSLRSKYQQLWRMYVLIAHEYKDNIEMKAELETHCSDLFKVDSYYWRKQLPPKLDNTSNAGGRPGLDREDEAYAAREDNPTSEHKLENEDLKDISQLPLGIDQSDMESK